MSVWEAVLALVLVLYGLIGALICPSQLAVMEMAGDDRAQRLYSPLGCNRQRLYTFGVPANVVLEASLRGKRTMSMAGRLQTAPGTLAGEHELRRVGSNNGASSGSPHAQKPMGNLSVAIGPGLIVQYSSSRAPTDVVDACTTIPIATRRPDLACRLCSSS